MRHAEFNDPRLVVVYDAECVWGPDDDFFVSVVNETATMRFRTEGELRASLDAAGLTAVQIYGGWHRQSVGAGDGEYVVITQA